jgi:hypothetical protein
MTKIALSRWKRVFPQRRGFRRAREDWQSSLPQSEARSHPNRVKEEVHKLLCKERPDFGRPRLTDLPGVPRPISLSARPPRRVEEPPIVTFTDAEWEAAREIYQKRYDEAPPAWWR